MTCLYSYNWEGADEPLESSIRGEMGEKANQLIGPLLFEDDGQLFLLNSGGGEQAIGIVKLDMIES